LEVYVWLQLSHVSSTFRKRTQARKQTTLLYNVRSSKIFDFVTMISETGEGNVEGKGKDHVLRESYNENTDNTYDKKNESTEIKKLLNPDADADASIISQNPFLTELQSFAWRWTKAYAGVGASCLFYYLFRRWFARRFLPTPLAQGSQERRERAELYVLSGINASVTSGYSLLTVARDFYCWWSHRRTSASSSKSHQQQSSSSTNNLDSNISRHSSVTSLSSLFSAWCRSPTSSTAASAAACAVVKKCFSLIGDPSATMAVLTFMQGYFAHDFFATRHHWLKYPADVWHHIVALLLIHGCFCMPSVAGHVYKVLVIECSTIFLTGMWLLREAMKMTEATQRANEGGAAAAGAAVVAAATMKMYKTYASWFVASFFLTRIVWLPYFTWRVVRGPEYEEVRRSYGVLYWTMVPLCVLQFYWFGKMLNTVVFATKK
jgi:hypothetical protein